MQGPHVALVLVLAAMISIVAAPSPDGYVEGELLVKFRGGPRDEREAQVRRAFGHSVRRDFTRIGWQQIQLPPGQTVDEVLERYRRHSDVLAVEPNYRLHAVAMSAGPGVVPNDPRFVHQWALHAIGATNAWAVSTGSSNVVVAVIDSGIRYDHEDLAPNMWRNPGESGDGKETNGLDDDGNGYVDDVYGIDVVSGDGDPMDGWWSAFPHGTMATGPIGAVGNNGRGIAGVSWSVQLMALRFLSQSGFVTSDMFIETCAYILDQKSRGVNIRVTSSGWGFGTSYPGEAVREAIGSLGEAGIINVFAAGDERVDLDGPVTLYPQSYQLPNMLKVAASDRLDNFAANVSNWGLNTVDLAAPGVNILTTYGTTTNDYVELYSGTSFSCPLVAGSAALLAAAHPHANAGQIRSALLLTVDVVNDLTNRVASGGRLNVGRAIAHPGLAPDAAPFIARSPRSQTVSERALATLEVTASGPGSLVYQWQHEGSDLMDATNAILALSGVDMADSGPYRVVVGNDYGSAISDPAILTVANCPLIQTQPQGMRVADGSAVSLSVEVLGAAPLAFQWQRDNADILGATNATRLVANVAPMDSGDYRVVIANNCGAVTSEVAQVTVVIKPWIITQPQSITLTQGATVTLCATVTNTAALPASSFWLGNNMFVGDAPVTQFETCITVSNVQPTLAGTWYALLANEATELSGSSIVTSEAYVTVVLPPAHQDLVAGQEATFTIVAHGTAPITYQWQRTGVSLIDSPKYSGATSSTLRILDVHGPDTGDYTVVVRNAAGEPTAFSASLRVLPTVRLVHCLPDCPPPCLQWCVEVCWPGSGCHLLWTEDLSEPWQPWTGTLTHEAGLVCARIPATGNMMFFRVECAP